MCTVVVIEQSCKQANRLILWGVGGAPHQDVFYICFIFKKNDFSLFLNPIFYGLCGQSATTVMAKLGFSITNMYKT
jgi:hypothetical protein